MFSSPVALLLLVLAFVCITMCSCAAPSPDGVTPSPFPPQTHTYTSSGNQEWALLLSPGKGKGCNLRKYNNLRTFVMNEAPYYENLVVEYHEIQDPKIKFYETKEKRDAAMIRGEVLSEEDIQNLLNNGPNPTYMPLMSLELAPRDPPVDELIDLLKQHNIQRGPYDPLHSSLAIFPNKKGKLVPKEEL